jgi:hypothetical protein
VSQYSPKHKAPGRHKARRRFAPGATPAFAAVTAASVSVTGVVAGGTFLAGGFDGFSLGSGDPDDSNLVLADLNLPGPLTTKTADRLAGRSDAKSDRGTPRYTQRTVTPKATATPVEQLVDASGGSLLDRTAAERRRAEERASRDLERYTPGSAKRIAAEMVQDRGWSSAQMECLNTLWERESGWRVSATNPSSGAYGIPQAWPGDKMATAGSDWRTNARTQITWGLNYIADRYDTPCGAWYFWQNNNHY